MTATEQSATVDALVGLATSAKQAMADLIDKYKKEVGDKDGAAAASQLVNAALAYDKTGYIQLSFTVSREQAQAMRDAARADRAAAQARATAGGS